MRNINAASWRTFKFQVLTRDMKPLLRFERMAHHPWAVVKVFDPNGKYQGKVKRTFNPISKSYALHSRSGIVFGRIRSPLWKSWNFPLFNVNGRQTGAVQKKWRGLLEEFATNADNSKVDFPEKASASEKAVILAAAITIDFNHFERSA